jgi:surface polysaccharide O-acyltransferase-like enzyme
MTIAAAGALPLNSSERKISTLVVRDAAIDTMRGVAILMVIGIHSLRAPEGSGWATAIDAALRPCVPIFLFTSGYILSRTGEVRLTRRLKAVLAPYLVAFIAAYAYMALHNTTMDHRPWVAITRFVFAYVFVYYYVFIYIGCTILLWLVFRSTLEGNSYRRQWLVPLLIMSIFLGLLSGAYVGPFLHLLGLSNSLIDEIRLRDLPFWFGFTALGVLVGVSGATVILQDLRRLLLVAGLLAFVVSALVRSFHVGDAAPYDSIAFFTYAALFCLVFLAFSPESHLLAAIGSGSYFIYLWHIFFVLLLRDTLLQNFGLVVNAAVTYFVTLTASILLLFAIRRTQSGRLRFWLGA